MLWGDDLECMFGTQMICHPFCPGRFVVVLLGKTNGEGLYRCIGMPGKNGGHKR